MATVDLSEINDRKIKELDEKVKEYGKFKDDIDRLLHTAKYVAAVLGLLAVLFGGFMKYVADKVKRQNERLEKVEGEILGWEKKVQDAAIMLNEKETEIIKAIEAVSITAEENNKSKSEADLKQKLQAINSFSESKKKDISTVGVRYIMNILQNGSSTITLKKMTILNNAGKDVVSIGSDNSENGFLAVKSKKGKDLLRMTRDHEGGIINVYANDGKIRKEYKY